MSPDQWNDLTWTFILEKSFAPMQTHTHTHIHTHAFTHTYIHTHIYMSCTKDIYIYIYPWCMTYIYMCACIYIYIYICVRMYVHICVYVYICVCVRIYIYIYVCMYVYICVYIYIYIYIFTIPCTTLQKLTLVNSYYFNSYKWMFRTEFLLAQWLECLPMAWETGFNPRWSHIKDLKRVLDALPIRYGSDQE